MQHYLISFLNFLIVSLILDFQLLKVDEVKTFSELFLERKKNILNRCFVLQNFRIAKKSGVIFYMHTKSTFSSDTRQSMKRRIPKRT